jgi:hypothetical protein
MSWQLINYQSSKRDISITVNCKCQHCCLILQSQATSDTVIARTEWYNIFITFITVFLNSYFKIYSAMAVFITVSWKYFVINCDKVLRKMSCFKLEWWKFLLPGIACIPLSNFQTTIISLTSSLHHLSFMWASLIFTMGVLSVILHGYL